MLCQTNFYFSNQLLNLHSSKIIDKSRLQAELANSSVAFETKKEGKVNLSPDLLVLRWGIAAPSVSSLTWCDV